MDVVNIAKCSKMIVLVILNVNFAINFFVQNATIVQTKGALNPTNANARSMKWRMKKIHAFAVMVKLTQCARGVFVEQVLPHSRKCFHHS